MALRRAFLMLCKYEVASIVQCDVMPLPLSADYECGRVKRPPPPISAEAGSSPLLKKRLHKKQMNVHSPAFYPSVPEDSEL